ncbi:DNA methyltransferase [Glutamicibacter soli]
MPSFDSIIVGEDWISEHYFTTDSTKESFQGEVLRRRKLWDEDAKAGHPSALSRFSQHRCELQVRLAALAEDPSGVREAYGLMRTALGFNGATAPFTAERSGTETVLSDVWNGTEGEVIFLESEPADSIEDFLGTGKPLGNVIVDGKEDTERTAAKLISELYLADAAPKYIVAMAGKWLVLTEQERWAEGRYLAADVLLVADRNDSKRGQEIDRFLATFGRDALMPSPDGTIWWDDILESSVKHTVGVSKDLREGIRRSIEIIANDVLTRRAAQGLTLEEIDGQDLARQSLRFLYRILFLLYAEASPELGVLPVGAGEYNEGYGLDRLRELTLVEIHEDRSLRGTHFFESLNVLFKRVDKGHNPEDGREGDSATSSNEGLRFDALKADLFAEKATSLINETKLSNSELQRVLQHLLLSKESRGKDRGFISYAELGINQLGAVYEGLMSYTGFIAETDLHEVAKDGDSSKGSWVVPVDRSESIEAKHFVKERNERTGELETVVHPKGSFVFRLAGRERQQSASYYTPEVLTKFVVSQALEELLDQDGKTTPADDILKLTVCEPALGSGAFAIEAVRQLAGEYLKRKQDELDIQIPADEYPQELQKVKAQIALHQVHGVDLNSTAVELAEVSLWLDTMTRDLQAPWFGLRLKRGNSLVGARRATYSVEQIKSKKHLVEEPQANPLTGLAEALELDAKDSSVVGRVHHFLLPGEGWGAAADVKEVKELAADAQKKLKTWVKSTRLALKKPQIERLLALSERVEILWSVALRRLQIAESQVKRFVDYWPHERAGEKTIVTRVEIESALSDPNGVYQRLKRVMNAWNALWFWPLRESDIELPYMDEWIGALEGILGKPIADSSKGPRKFGLSTGQTSALSVAGWNDLAIFETYDFPLAGMKEICELEADYPWLVVCERIAAEQGFFHWELEFASVFGRGGFDLQVGNPPWVRPRSDEAALLAEGDPWWQLTEKPAQKEIKIKREHTLAQDGMLEFFVENAIVTPVVAEYLGASSTYPVLSGLQPDLYRVFMVRTWASASPRGIIALIHPESHFTEKRATQLRSSTYQRLRSHWHFMNQMHLFEIGATRQFGVHIYGNERLDPEFKMMASLVHPETVKRSEDHDGSGEVPGLKDHNGKWETRPHKERLLRVDSSVLRVWADILDEPGTSPLHARMVYPVNRASMTVLEKLSKAPRVRELGLQYSSGWHETADRKKGYFEVGSAVPKSWDDVILQGPHFTVANPFAKQPNPTMKSKGDWTAIDLEALPADYVPRTSYQRKDGRLDRTKYDHDYDHFEWRDGNRTSARDHYRIAWRSMAAPETVRTLFPAVIPCGAAHVHAVRTAATANDVNELHKLLVTAGMLGSITVDFQVKVSVGSEISSTFINQLPCQLHHPLADEIARRVLELAALTNAYADLWFEMTGEAWTWDSAIRRERERRQAQLEIDVAAALALGLTAEELTTIYRTQFPVLRNYEKNDLYDANGRKVPGEINKLYRHRGDTLTVDERTWTHPQSGVEYVFEFPFRSFDREEDMRKAYAHFEQLLAEKQIEELAK